MPIALGRTYERFLGLPPPFVLAVMWMSGVALLGSITLVLYSASLVLVQAVAGSIQAVPALLHALYLPKCVEGLFSEVGMQHLV